MSAGCLTMRSCTALCEIEYAPNGGMALGMLGAGGFPNIAPMQRSRLWRYHCPL